MLLYQQKRMKLLSLFKLFQLNEWGDICHKTRDSTVDKISSDANYQNQPFEIFTQPNFGLINKGYIFFWQNIGLYT